MAKSITQILDDKERAAFRRAMAEDGPDTEGTPPPPKPERCAECAGRGPVVYRCRCGRPLCEECVRNGCVPCRDAEAENDKEGHR